MDENGCGGEGRFETCPYGIGCNTGVNCSRRDIFIVMAHDRFGSAAGGR